MVTLAGGMESDVSCSEDDMVYSTDKDLPMKEPISFDVEERKKVPNGGITNATESNGGNHNTRGPSNFHLKNRNQNHHQRRQCIDLKSTQTFDDLRYAIMQGNLETTESILSKGILVDTILKAGWTGLMYACSSGQHEIVSFLLDKKADPNFHRDMFTPLMAACAAKKTEEDLLKCCRLLLKKGAKVDAHERHFTTPLMFATREGYMQIVKELLNHNASPNLQDNRGNTALSWAASGGHGQVVRILIEHGSDRNLYNKMGQSAVDLASEYGHNEIVSLLQKGHFLQTPSGESCSANETQIEKSKVVSTFTRSNDSKSFVKVGELDLFLSGIGFPELVATFNEQQLSFHDLLIMNDLELEKAGVNQIGARKKILEACKSVHKKEWENSSLPDLRQRQYISCSDAVAMMANIAKHLKYISNSVLYIRQQIQSQPRILELSQDSANVHNLVDEMADSLKNIQFLNDELRFLKLHLEKVQDQVQYIPADLIIEIKPSYKNQAHLWCAAIGITTISIALAGFLWKNPGLLETIPTAVRIRLPFLN